MSFNFGNIIVTLILIATGVFFVAKAYYLNHHVVFLGWVEKKWGPGTGTLAYKVIGLALIVLATLVISGAINVFEDPLETVNRNQGGNNFDNSTSPNPTRNIPSNVNLSP